MPMFTIPVSTTGTAGNATGSVITTFEAPLMFIEAIQIDYHASAPATTDVTIWESDGLGRAILTLSNQNADRVVYPRHATHLPDGTDGAGDDLFIVEGGFQIDVAGCNELSPAVIVKVMAMIGDTVR